MPVLVAAAAVSLVGSAFAATAGFPTNLSKRTVHIAAPKAPLRGAGRAYIQVYAKTNLHGQITTLIPSNIEAVPVTCTKGGNVALGTESDARYDHPTRVSASGAFEYHLTLSYAPIEFKVSGKFSAHGTRISGTVTAIQTTPEFEAGYSQGCHIATSVMPFSAGLKWARFH